MKFSTIEIILNDKCRICYRYSFKRTLNNDLIFLNVSLLPELNNITKLHCYKGFAPLELI